jgi:ADP-ribose pyrophosphatase YjhB (NUDIX family)
MPSVYAVLYDAAGNVLMATRVVRTYFNADADKVWENGCPLKPQKAPGQPALPGGDLKTGESPADGAKREFFEETKIDISSLTPTAVYTTTNYVAVYFLVPDLPAKDQQMINNLNLAENTVVPKIQSRQIIYYDQIRYQYPNCPMDNELMVPTGSKTLYNLNDPADWSIIQSWQNTNYQDWYYEILRYLKQNILPTPQPVRGD